MIVDAHHHFWNYNTEEFGWIDDSMSVIQKSFLVEELELEMKRANVDAAVSVQARTSQVETDFLLSCANASENIAAVVGWFDLCSSDLEANMDPYTSASKLKGVREICQGQKDGFMLRPAFLNGVKTVLKQGWTYDILIFANQLKEATTFVDQFESGKFVVDHLAKPDIKAGEIKLWEAGIRELAKREHVMCKLSGMVTEADWNTWTPEQLAPYVDVVLEAFGPERIMLGSDWPVALVATEYDSWVEQVKAWASPLTSAEQAHILGKTAQSFYGI